MSRRAHWSHAATVGLAVAALALSGCGGNDDDDLGADVDAAGEVADTDTDPAGTDPSDDATSSDDDASALVTIDGQPYEFEVEYCLGGVDSLARIAGPGTAPDGQPFWAEVRWGLGGPVTAQLGFQADEPSGGDQPDWVNRLEPGADHVDFDDDRRVTIRYEAPFERVDDRDADSGDVDGSVDATCIMT